MKVYFDKENYLNYLKSSRKSVLAQDTLRMIKNQLSVHLNFDTETFSDEEFKLHEEFTEGVSREFNITHGKNVVIRPVKDTSFPTMDGIYLLESDINYAKRLNSVLLGALNEETNVLSRLIISDDYSFHAEKRIGIDVLPNKHLNINDLPFTTLVIIDRYIFKGPDPGGNIGLYEYNLAQILKNIYSKKNGKTKIVFVYQVNVQVPKDNPKYDEGPDVNKLNEKIRRIVNKNCPAPEIYFFGVPSGYIDDEHDRWILSNYLRIKSGDSLVYFDSNGQIKSDSLTIDLYSLGSRSYRTVNQDIVDKINNICEKTSRQYPRFCKIPNNVGINRLINLS